MSSDDPESIEGFELLQPSADQRGPGDQFLPEIRRARFTQLTIYEVEESELTILERGSPVSLYLNIAIALLSTAVALTVSLATAEVRSESVLVILLVITVIGYMQGAILLLFWWRRHRSIHECASAIRRRLPPEWADALTEEHETVDTQE